MSDKPKTVTFDADARIPMREVADFVANIYGGDPVSRQAVYQWASIGRKTKGGGMVKLQTTRVRGFTFTTAAFIKAFIEVL